jgi:hypothetical protein
MSQSNNPTSFLRQRMLQDMAMRKFSQGTQRMYVNAVVDLTKLLGERLAVLLCHFNHIV